MSEVIRILHVEDSDTDALLVARELERSSTLPVTIQRVATIEAMCETLRVSTPEIILSDWCLGEKTGADSFVMARELAPDVPFVLVSGGIGEEMAVAMMRLGAGDYVLKDNLGRLAAVIEREVRDAAGRRAKKQAEEALRRSEERLRDARRMEAVGRAASGIAHDFKNVLAIIMSFSDIVLGDPSATDSVRADVDEIRKAVVRANDIVRKLGVVDQPPPADRGSADVGECIGAMSKLVAQLTGPQVAVAIPAPPSSLVTLSRVEIEQILLNLVLNARDAMPNGGTLSITTEGPRDGYLKVAVRDTGVGMDRATRDRIFEPFFTTKGDKGGTGLGLFTVFGVVRQAGGIVEVDSELGEGTTFSVYLPAAVVHDDFSTRGA